METYADLRDGLEFTNDGKSVTIGHELFESYFQSWVSNEIQEDWIGDIVVISPAYGEPFTMTRAEYQKI